MKTAKKCIDCECNGTTCCGGVGIAVFQVERDGKLIRVCTRCDFSTDKNKKILRYAQYIPKNKLMQFDALGAVCLENYLKNGDYPLTKGLYR